MLSISDTKDTVPGKRYYHYLHNTVLTYKNIDTISFQTNANFIPLSVKLENPNLTRKQMSTLNFLRRAQVTLLLSLT